MTFLEKYYHCNDMEPMFLEAKEANRNIEKGFRVVFSYDDYWGGPVFHLEEEVELNFLFFKKKIWRKVKSGNNYGTGSIYVTAFNAEFHKKYTIKEVLEKRRFTETFSERRAA